MYNNNKCNVIYIYILLIWFMFYIYIYIMACFVMSKIK